MAQKLEFQITSAIVTALARASGIEFSPRQSTDSSAQIGSGFLTFDAEGTANPRSPYYSRRASVPSDSSGVTIGRGYDLSKRSSAEVLRDLFAAGVPREAALSYARAAGVKGSAAREFLLKNALPEISGNQEIALFNQEYARISGDVARICNKADVVAKYGPTDWNALTPAIKEVLVDLRYRGDYTPRARTLIQAAVAQNDLGQFAEAISDRALWPSVPTARFNARRLVMENALGR